MRMSTLVSAPAVGNPLGHCILVVVADSSGWHAIRSPGCFVVADALLVVMLVGHCYKLLTSSLPSYRPHAQDHRSLKPAFMQNCLLCGACFHRDAYLCVQTCSDCNRCLALLNHCKEYFPFNIQVRVGQVPEVALLRPCNAGSHSV